ncbi:hypothetical protein vseg_016921 [Gypsophila vaccaria]
MEYEDPTLFEGVRFYLAGFTPLTHDQVKSTLVSKGGVYVANYSDDCTHVVVQDLVLDDPICVAAIRDKKALVTTLWVEHSLDAGELLDVSNIMYRPLKDLKGIPGAENFVICLTGYQKYQREDIMRMTELMGAEFSKALVPNKVTHLICYKFEGEKYVWAKKLTKIKLTNHQWLEDCLKDWKILPEERYTRSGYEVELMEGEVNDSEDENGNVTEMVIDHKGINGMPNGQSEIGRALDNPVIESNALGPYVQGMSSSVRVDEAMLPLKPEPVSELKNLRNNGEHSPMHQNNHEQNERKTPVISARPLHIQEELGNQSGPSSKQSTDFTPLNSRETPKRSNVSAVMSGASNRKMEYLESNDVRTPVTEVDKIKIISAGVEVSNSKGLSDVDTSKYCHLTSRNSDLSLQAEARPTISEDMVEDDLAEKGNIGVACNIPDGKISASKLGGISSLKGGLPDGEDVFSLQQTKQLASHLDVSRLTPKSQKLIPSAIGTDAADPATPMSSSHKKVDKGSQSIRKNAGIETARAPVDKLYIDFPSVKSNLNNVDTSRSLLFKSLQVGKSNCTDIQTSPVSGDITSSSVNNKKAKPQNLPENASSSPELKKLVAPNSGNPAVNSDGKTGSLASTSPKKKMDSRKTLGSRRKVSRKIVDDKKGSLTGIFSGVNAASNIAVQIDGKDIGNSSIPSTVDGSTASHDEPLQDFVFDINDYALPVSDDTDEAAVTNSTSTHNPDMPGAKIIGKEHGKKNMAPKVGISRRDKNKTIISAPKEVAGDADNDDVSGISSKKKLNVKGQTMATAGRKRCGDQVVKVPVQVENKHVVSDDPDASNGTKRLRNLTSHKRRGTVLLNMSDTPVEVEKDIESALEKDGPKQSENLSGALNSTDVLSPIQNENGSTAANRKCTNTGNNQIRKTRRGTLLLSKPDGCISDDKENSPVHHAKPRKLSCMLDNNIDVDGEGVIKGKKIAGKKRRGTLLLSKAQRQVEVEKENEPVFHDHVGESKGEASKTDLMLKKNDAVISDDLTSPNDCTAVNDELRWFIVSGHRLQRKEFQQLIKRLKGKHCRDSHQWSYQATHLIVPDPIRRTEKFFAAAASGRWILKTDYLTACSQAGKFLPEESYEWHKSDLTEDGAISLEAPRKWRLLREKTGHGAFYGMRILVYGECIAPPLDTLKRVVKAGDGTIMATSPPYTRILKSGVDFAIVSPGITLADMWVQEFLRHEIPCVSADYLVEFVCKPGYPLDRHVQYNTHDWAKKSFSRLSDLSIESVADAATPENQVADDLACQVCGFIDRAEVMLICGDESGSTGCGVGTHIDCCDPPLEDVPDEDWFCPKCTTISNTKPPSSTKKKLASKRN